MERECLAFSVVADATAPMLHSVYTKFYKKYIIKTVFDLYR